MAAMMISFVSLGGMSAFRTNYGSAFHGECTPSRFSHSIPATDGGSQTAILGSAQETVKACPFIGFGLERFCPGALGCQRWSPGPQCFRAEGPCLMAAFRILQTTGNRSVLPIRQPWDSCDLGWYSPSEPGNAVRNPDSSAGSGNEPCRCAKPTAINGMRGFFPTSAA